MPLPTINYLEKRVRLTRSSPTRVDGMKVNKPLKKGEEGVVKQVVVASGGCYATVQFDGRLFGASGIPTDNLEIIE